MKLKSISQHFTADVLAPTGALAVRVDGMEPGTTLAPATRADLLKQLRAGEFAGPLLVDATTFVQRATPNRNFSRFKSGTLRSGARSFVGQVVLLNHDQRDVAARIGTIVKSRAEKVGDEVHFLQTLSIVKPAAMESVLDGTIDRFSIGWFTTGVIECSVHKGPMFGKDCCTCWPGDNVNGKAVEAVWTSWEGIEVSAVNVPAVVGTGIDQIRAALTALRAEDSGAKPHNHQRKEIDMNVRNILGLAETATDEEVAAELAKREGERKAMSLTLQQNAADEAANKAKLEQEQAAARKTRIDGAISLAYADGRLDVVRDSTGKQIASELETRIRSVASTSVDAAESLLSAMPKRHPNGDPTALQSKKPGAPNDDVAQRNVNSALDNMLPLMGLDAKDVEAYGPQHRKASPKNAPVPKHLSKLFATRFINDNPTR